MAVRGSRLTLALLVGVVVVVLVGTAAALTVSAAQRRGAVAAFASASTTTEPSKAAVSVTVGRARGGADLEPTTGPSTNQTVQLSSTARSHPHAEQIQQLLQAYFDAINNHDYTAWSGVVTAAQTKNQDSARWRQAYASTVDSSIWIQSLSGTPVRAALRFTSEQDPDLAPPDLRVDCINWVLSYQIEDQDGRLVVGSTVPETVTRTKCP